MLQNVRVLAIDQVADERADKPSVVKAVTLEVDVVGAQKLSLAASVGSLSLMLRKAGEANSQYTREDHARRSRRAVDADGGADGPIGVTTVACGGRRRARNTACRSKARRMHARARKEASGSLRAARRRAGFGEGEKQMGGEYERE